MKTSLLLAVALGVSATAGMASAETPIVVTTTVPTYCKGEVTKDKSLELDSLARPENGQVVSSFTGETVAELGSYYCTGPTSVTLTATPLTTPLSSTPDRSFTNRVDYVATLNWGSETSSVNTSVNNGSNVSAIDHANMGDIKVTIGNPAAILRPVAGTYTSSIKLTIASN